MRKGILLFITVFISFYLPAQQYLDFGFKRDLSMLVKDSLQNNFKNAWGGGLNSCQFSQIDLNQDGIKDLFVFDRSSGKILTFINNGNPNMVDYRYAPEYRDKFPPLHDWVELVDYNGDGKEDIFTSAYGGITVYKNVSTLSIGLKFSFVTYMLNSMQGTINTALLATTVDYPAIADIDNDGDLDILTFFGFGQYIEYHKNKSMELYGTADSLDFVLQEYCWGKFAESLNGNALTLDITCPYKSELTNKSSEIKHTGTTMLAADFNGDGIKDLLLGDVGYTNIIKLINGGNTNDALMISQDIAFPSNTQPINLVSFPVPCYLDVDNDSKKDLIVSPFDNSQNVAENLKSCWFYKNTGTNSSPVFEYQYNNFLQKDMIETGSGSYPVLYDYDGDGLLDLFIGNYGVRDSSYLDINQNLISHFTSRIALYKNIGTASNPQFQFITNDFANLAHLKLSNIIPAFGDINGDGVAEMIIGKSDGKLDYYRNTASAGNPMNMVLSQSNYMGIHVDASQNNPSSAPQLVDLDGDSLLDLVIGARNGKLYFFKNTGDKTNPHFTFITDTLGGVNVVKSYMSNYGYSVPCFFKDSTGHFRLFVGSESGCIFYYKDIENNLNGHFTLVDTMYLTINEGYRSAMAVANLNNDNYLDMIIGNFSGGVSYFKGVTPSQVNIKEHYSNNLFNFQPYPNPADKLIYLKTTENISFNKLSLKIYNIIGNSIPVNYSVTNSQLSIDISNLQDGLYFYTITAIDKAAHKEISGKGKFMVIH